MRGMGSISLKSSIELQCDPASPLPCVLPKEVKIRIQTHICIQISIAAVFAISKM
jgi:hypothetical protein